MKNIKYKLFDNVFKQVSNKKCRGNYWSIDGKIRREVYWQIYEQVVSQVLNNIKNEINEKS